MMNKQMFALVVFVSDGLLKTKATGVKAGAKRTRFYDFRLNSKWCCASASQGDHLRERDRGGIQGTGQEARVVFNLHQIAPPPSTLYPLLPL